MTDGGLKRMIRGGLRSLVGRTPAGLGLSGDYGSWNEALAASIGYGDEGILDKTRLAALKAKKGEVAFERDSVAFENIEYSWPLLTALLWVAARSGGNLSVLDYGGSLGSTYYQHRAFLDGLGRVRWSVVEQPAHVEVGKREFQDEQLRFYETADAAVAESSPDVIVLSSVLQYLDDPHSVLDYLLEVGCDYLVLDRTTVWDGPRDRLCVQQVPPEIYDASYPCWVFSEAALLLQLKVAGFDVFAGLGTEVLRDGDFVYREFGAVLVRGTAQR